MSTRKDNYEHSWLAPDTADHIGLEVPERMDSPMLEKHRDRHGTPMEHEPIDTTLRGHWGEGNIDISLPHNC